MLFIYLYHGDLYSDLWKSDLYFRPTGITVTHWRSANSFRLLINEYHLSSGPLRDVQALLRDQ